MRRIALLFLLATLAGCKSTTGPLASRQKPQKPDPLYNAEEQQRFTRERYSYPVENSNILPNTFNDRYGPAGR